ncbi:MAG: hypothetical protein V2A79_19235 [Planctomycetota bacterium]
MGSLLIGLSKPWRSICPPRLTSNKVRQQLRADIEVQVRPVDRIETPASGKYRYVVSEAVS